MTRMSCAGVMYDSEMCSFSYSARSYLVLPLASRVVKVGIAPVVHDAFISLLVQPVELVGAALHVVSQTEQVLLTSRGACLGVNYTQKIKNKYTKCTMEL